MAGKDELATAKWRAMAHLQLDERGLTTYNLPFTFPSAFTFASSIIYAAFPSNSNRQASSYLLATARSRLQLQV